VRALLILAVFLAAGWTARGEGDLELLRDVICRIETQHLRPSETETERGDGAAGERGICQVLPETAHAVGYRGPPDMLRDMHVSRWIALEVLRKCQGSRTFDAHRLAYCFHGGFGRRYTMRNVWWGYANRAALAFLLAKARLSGVRAGG
jgi:hypothetical protein